MRPEKGDSLAELPSSQAEVEERCRCCLRHLAAHQALQLWPHAAVLGGALSGVTVSSRFGIVGSFLLASGLLFEASFSGWTMGTRGTKRKRGEDIHPSTAAKGQAVPLAFAAPAPHGLLINLDSGTGSSTSGKSDASSAPPCDNDINVAARFLTAVCATSPEGVRSFVRRVSPATVVRSLDLDLIRPISPQKVMPIVICF